MKEFTSLNDLFDYCQFCPLCKQHSMLIDISVGPDDCFEQETYSKKNNKLFLSTVFYHNKTKTKIKFNIDCLSNKFDISISDPISSDYSPHHTYDPFFYFYLQSVCGVCKKSRIYSNDIELSLTKKEISNLSLEREAYILSKTNLSLDHVNNTIRLLDVHTRRNIYMPLFNLDFSDLNKLENKISTIFTFS